MPDIANNFHDTVGNKERWRVYYCVKNERTKKFYVGRAVNPVKVGLDTIEVRD